MQIILEQNEIEAALIAYATSMISLREDQDISIDMKAGRGENGYSATLDIRQKVVVATSTKSTTRAKVLPEAPKPEMGSSTSRTEAAPAASVKTGLFNKPAFVTEAPKEEPVAEAQALTEEPVAGISTGEDRGEAPEASPADEPVEVVGEATQVEAEAPAPQPTKSIFNFQKPAANG